MHLDRNRYDGGMNVFTRATANKLLSSLAAPVVRLDEHHGMQVVGTVRVEHALGVARRARGVAQATGHVLVNVRPSQWQVSHLKRERGRELAAEFCGMRAIVRISSELSFREYTNIRAGLNTLLGIEKLLIAEHGARQLGFGHVLPDVRPAGMSYTERSKKKARCSVSLPASPVSEEDNPLDQRAFGYDPFQLRHKRDV